MPVPVSSSCGVMYVVFGDDGGTFALVLCKMGPCPVLTVVCIRANACVWPQYKVKLHLTGPPAVVDFSMDTITTVMEPTSCPSPGKFKLEDLTTFVTVPQKYFTTYGNQAVMGV